MKSIGKIVKVERVTMGILYSVLKVSFYAPSSNTIETATWMWCDAPEQFKALVTKGSK